MIYILVIWFLLCLLVAKFADIRGRYAFGFFWLAFFCTPLIGGLILLLLPKNEEAMDQRKIDGGARKCPHCAEIVKREALVCRFCGKSISSGVPTVKSYAVSKNGKSLGRFTATEIRQRLNAKQITMEDCYFDEMANDWMPLDFLPELAALR